MMSKLNKFFSLFFCIVIVICSFSFLGNAADIKKEKEYKPLDLVIVIDSSGSMNDSDKNRTALAAVKMLVNMMPAKGSRVGVVGFNTEASVLTKDSKGKNALLPLDNLNETMTVKKSVTDVIYNGGTGIGNAVLAATDLLEANKSADRAQAVMLFTDGVNDFGNDVISLAKCEDNEASALLWAKDNECPIYCVGYDYITSDGVSSMGENGEGLKKLNNISSTTKGKFKSINNIEEIEQLLIEFLADVCDLNYTNIDTIPGDGGKHECLIPVTPSVVEADIRIAGGDKNSIENGKIQLFDPDGNEVELRNSGNIRFDTDATAASIKVIMPKTGKWRLVLEGITGDDINVGLLEHFKMNLSSKITLPEGNPDGVAYSNDEVKIKSWLSYDGQILDDEALYSSVKSATAVCVPRADPDSKKIVNLTRDGLSFVGSFIIPQDCYYDITIRLDWDTVYREDTLEIQSSNKPCYLTGTKIPDVKLNKNKTFVINDIYQYVADDENDSVTASIASITSPDVAGVTVNGNDITITGKKMSSTLVTVEFKDDQGNVVDTSFTVKVNDPLVWIILALIILAIIAAVILIPYFSYLKSLKIKGTLFLTKIEYCESNEDYDRPKIFEFTDNGEYESVEDYPDAISIMMDSFYRRKKEKSVKEIIYEIVESLRDYEPGTIQNKAREALNSNVSQQLMVGAGKSKIIGTPRGGSFDIKVNKKTPFLKINRNSKIITVSNETQFDLCFKDENNRNNRKYIKLSFYFISPVRVKNNNKKRR